MFCWVQYRSNHKLEGITHPQTTINKKKMEHVPPNFSSTLLKEYLTNMHSEICALCNNMTNLKSTVQHLES